MPEIFTLNNVVLDAAATDRLGVLVVIARTAVERGYASDEADVVDGMLAREAESSTALMDQIAIPHAKTLGIHATALIVVRTANAVDWDGEPISLGLAMLVPEVEAGTTHLKLLAQVARALVDEDLRAGLLAAPDELAVFNLLKPKFAI